MAEYKNEKDHQWDFIADGLAYLYMDGENGSAVVVGQDFQKHFDNVPGLLDYSNYIGNKSIPEYVTNPRNNKTYVVKKISKWAFFSALRVPNVSLPSTIEEIEDEAFKSASYLTIIKLNEGLKRIGAHAFEYCLNLTSVIIPDSVTSIGSQAFFNCQELTEVTIGRGITRMDEVFRACKKLKAITCRAVNPPAIRVNTFTDEVFQNAVLYVPFLSYELYKKYSSWFQFKKIEPIPETIPTTGPFYFKVDGIRYMAKDYNSNEVYVAPLEDTVYDENKFVSRLSVQSGRRPVSPRAPKPAGIEIPSQVQFAGKTYVVTGIDKHAFSEAKTTTVKIPNTVKDIEYAAFKNAKITKIEIPSSVQFIKDSAFFGCENLTEVDVPGSVAYIEDSAFGYCKNLNKITLHKGLKRIGDCAFEGAKEVQQLIIPDTVLEIGASAFYQVGCNNPNRLALTIPDSVVFIGNNAFFECRIKKLTLGKGLTEIGDGVFRKSELKELVIPDKITSIGKKAFAYNDNNFQTITCESSTPPKIEADTFDAQTFENATLNVLDYAIDKYKKDPVWGKFGQFEEFTFGKRPKNANRISEPIRYISLKNEGAFLARMRVSCDSVILTTNYIAAGEDCTLDLATEKNFSKDGLEVWLRVVIGVHNEKIQAANQIFVYGGSSKKKACYTIKGTDQVNSLSYDGIKENE